VGNPVRKGFDSTAKDAAKKALGLDARPVVLSFGGSLGATAINRAAAELMATCQKDKKIQYLHGYGRLGKPLMPKLLAERGVNLSQNPQFRVLEYIDDMDRFIAAADLVICRAGAITLSELAAAKKAAILIPSPNVSNNHQYYNALAFEKAGAAVVIEEKDLSEGRITSEFLRLISDRTRLSEMGEAAGRLRFENSAEIIAKEVLGG